MYIRKNGIAAPALLIRSVWIVFSLYIKKYLPLFLPPPGENSSWSSLCLFMSGCDLILSYFLIISRYVFPPPTSALVEDMMGGGKVIHALISHTACEHIRQCLVFVFGIGFFFQSSIWFRFGLIFDFISGLVLYSIFILFRFHYRAFIRELFHCVLFDYTELRQFSRKVRYFF